MSTRRIVAALAFLAATVGIAFARGLDTELAETASHVLRTIRSPWFDVALLLGGMFGGGVAAWLVGIRRLREQHAVVAEQLLPQRPNGNTMRLRDVTELASQQIGELHRGQGRIEGSIGGLRDTVQQHGNILGRIEGRLTSVENQVGKWLRNPKTRGK